MSFAELQNYIRQDFATLTDSDAGVDALTARLMVNNAQHAFDQSAQTLCNWSDTSLANATYSVTTTPTIIFLCGPFPARLRPDIGFYLYRMRAHIARTGADPVEFRFSVGPINVLQNHLRQTGTLASVFSTSVNTASTTTVTPASSIRQAFYTSVPTSYGPITTKDDAGNIVGASAPLMYVGVSARSTVGTQTARLAGLYVAEYVGTP